MAGFTTRLCGTIASSQEGTRVVLRLAASFGSILALSFLGLELRSQDKVTASLDLLSMAEPVGLAFGAASLVTVFDTAMSTFERIQTAREYGKEYQQLAFQTSLLRLRLSRCAQGVELLEMRSRVDDATELETVQNLLVNIQEGIQDTEKFAKRYKTTDTAPPPPTDDKELATMQALIERTSKLAVNRQKQTSLTRKTRWALRDRDRFKGLIKDLNGNVTQLENLFPADQKRRLQLVKSDAEQLIQATEVEEVDDRSNAETNMTILAEVATVVDSALKEALQKVLDQSTATHDVRRHIFKATVTATEHAKIEIGDYVEMGSQVIGYGIDFGGQMNASGNAQVRYGTTYTNNARSRNSFGWKYVLDD